MRNLSLGIILTLSFGLTCFCLSAHGELLEADVLATCTAPGTEVDTREEHVAYAALGGEGVEVVGDTDIAGDVTWTADRTWIVTGIVLVKGGTLTIEPGAEVLLGVGSGIRQDGGSVVFDGVEFMQLSDEQVLAFATAPGTPVDTREEHDAYAALGGEGVEIIGDIDYAGDVTWTADKTWIVTGIVLVKGGTLTIEPGAKVLLGVGSGIRQDGGAVVSDGVAFMQLSDEQMLAFATAPGTEVDTREEHDAYAALGGEAVEVVGDVDYTGDVTWTADKTWIVTGIVLVKGGTLTIEPGAKVLLGVGSGIRQDGGAVVSDGVAFMQLSDEQMLAFATAPGTEVDTREEHDAYAALGGEAVEVVGDVDYTGDVTWTADKTWIVTGIVLVKGGTLTIEPGAKVLLGVGSGIRQDGGAVVSDGVAFANMCFDGRMDYAEAEKDDVRLDTDVGKLRVAAEEEPLTFSTMWGESAAANVKVSFTTAYGDGAEVVSEAGPAEGEYLWSADTPGYYTFTHEAGDETLTALFFVADSEATETVFEGEIAESADWPNGKVILIDGIVTVKSGATLTIAPGAVVKFMNGAGIVCEAGGRCVADGVIFTHVNDDTVGGDTLLDGATAPLADMYVLNGVSGDDATQYRYHPDPTVTLSGTIAKNEVWRGFNVYHVTGDITVPSGVTLTVEPGAIIKFDPGLSLTVNGGATLNAIGTRAQPIVFTSIRDDNYGGDTNGDGNKTMPYPADWGCVLISGGNVQASYCRFTYGSGVDGNQYGARACVFMWNGGSGTFDGCLFGGSLMDGCFAQNATFRNCIFTDCDRGLVSHTGTITAINCVATYNRIGFFSHGGLLSVRNSISSLNLESAITGDVGSRETSGCYFGDDPKFLDAANGDYRIAANSPCVDAADAEYAPETDYFGQPRINAPDIGICEVMPRGVTSDIDLVPTAVAADAEAVSGQLLTVSWTVENQGGADVDAEWRDTVSLVSESGRTVELGDKVVTKRLVAGGAVSCSASFIVPAIAEGAWYPKVVVNSYRDIFEGALGDNNALTGGTAVNVGINSISLAELSTQVVPSSSSVIYRLVGLPSASGALVFSGDLAHLTFLNVANTSNDVGRAGISLPDGRFVLPFDASSELQYLTVANTSDRVAEFAVTVVEDALQVMALSQMSVSNRGKTTIDIYGMGLTNVTSVALDGNGKRYEASSFSGKSSTEMYANFDATSWATGTYDLVVSTDDLTARIGNVTVFANGIGPKVTCSIEKPDAVRMGRWYTAKITCTNEGDEDAHVPIVTLMGVSETFKDPDNGIAEKKGSVRLFMLSRTGNPLVLKAGQSVSASVQFSSMASSSGFTLASQCFVPGIDEVQWSNLFRVSGKKGETLLQNAMHIYGETTEPYIDAIFQEVLKCVDAGFYPKCADEFYESCFKLEKAHLIVGSVIEDANDELLVEGVVRLTSNGHCARYGCINSDGRFFVYGLTAQEVTNIHYSVVNVLDPVQVDSKHAESDIVDILLRLNNKEIDHSGMMGMLLSSNRIVRVSLVNMKNATTPLAVMQTVQGDLHLVRIYDNEFCIIDTAYHGDGEYYTDYCVVEQENDEIILIGRLGEGNKIYKFELSNESIGAPEYADILDDRGKIICCRYDGKMIMISNTGEDLIINPALEFATLSKKTAPLKGIQPGENFSWDFSWGGELFEVSGSATVRTAIDKTGCCSWNERGKAEVSGGCRIWPLPHLSIPYGVEVDMNITCDREENCSGKATKILSGSETVSGGIALSRSAENSLIDAIDFAVKEAILAQFNLTAVLINAKPVKNDLSVGGAVTVSRKDTLGEDGVVLDSDWDLGVKTYVDWSLDYGAIIDMPSGVGGGFTQQFADINAEYGCSIGSSGISINHGVVSVRFGQWQGEASFDISIWGNVTFEPFTWKRLYGIGETKAAKLKETRLLSTKSSSGRSFILDSQTTIDSLKLIPRNPIVVPNSKGAYIFWEKDALADGNVIRTPQGALFNRQSGDITPLTLDLPSNAAIIGKSFVSIDSDDCYVVFAIRMPDENEDSLYCVKITKDGLSGALEIIDVAGRITNLNMVKEADGTIGVVYSIYSGGVHTVIINEIVNGVCLQEGFILDSSDEPILQLSAASGIDGGVCVCYFKGNEYYVCSKECAPFKVSSQSFINEEKFSFNETKRLMASVNKANAILMGASSKTDGCDDDCDCGCGFHFACGCPETCPCQGNCKEDEQCCDCTDKYGTLIHRSNDPNELVGSLGVGDPETQRFVKPGEQLTYTIYFENKEDATAAAQEVYVTNPLSEWLDWSTFEMGEIAFGNQIDLGLSGKKRGSCDATMKGTNFVVRTRLAGDAEKDADIAKTGVAYWYLRIVDPATKTGWPKDILAGFLPPNDETFRGEGHLTYRIKVRDDAPPGIVITNSASIVFDYNDPIETDPSWFNTVATIYEPTLDLGDGTTTNLTLIVGQPYGELPIPTAREGQTFVGWFTGENGTGRQVTAESIVEDGEAALFAQWSANTYLITFDANGGEGGTEEMLPYGTALVAPTVTWNGHKFTRWLPEVPATVPATDMVFTAQWDVVEYTIAFAPNGGSGAMDTVNVISSNPIALPHCAFTRAGHAFVGWATLPDGEVRYLDDSHVLGLTAIPNATVTLYAIWADKSDTSLVRDGDDLQAAIDAAPAGGLVLVYPGTYGPIEATGKSITVCAVFGQAADAPSAAPTIIDGGEATRCATLGDGAVLSGFILQNGAADFGGGALGGILKDCRIENCTAVADEEGNGGLGGGTYGSTISRCTITGCHADVNGGGLYEGYAENSVIYNCSSGDFGGGAYLATLVGCTVYGCSATTGAGVTGCAVQNSIVWENRLYGVDKKGVPLLGNCANITEGKKTLVKNVCTYTDSSPKPAGTGNLAKDPLFVDAANGDFRLQFASPAKNKGKATLAAGEFDLGGLPRTIGVAPDMGALEVIEGTPVPADYDGDGVCDAAYFDAVSATWVVMQSRDGLLVERFGEAKATPVPADYDGDGRADFATYSATAKIPEYHIRTRAGGELAPIALGAKGATPIAMDIDDDGIADPGVFQGNVKKPAFSMLSSSSGDALSFAFGTKGATPVTGDFDGDGIADFGCYTATASKPTFSVTLSGRGWNEKQPFTVTLGAKGSAPCCGDFDSDGVTDFAAYSGTAATPLLYRMFSTSKWREVRTLPFGKKGSRAVTSDWDGDGAADAAIEFQSQWWRVTREIDVSTIPSP